MSNISPSIMKPTLIFFTFLLITLSPNVSADDTSEAVLDISGNPLRAGTDYYILPVIRGRGGGLTLDSTTNESCPLDVVQARSELNNGLPIRFSPFNGDNVVRISVDQNFIFSASSICIQSTVWRLNNVNGEYVVSIGGVEGNPGRETLSNWFSIDKEGDYYKIVYCPIVCNLCRPFCGDVGVVINNDGIRRLLVGSGEVPHRVVFRKAEGSSLRYT